MEDRSRRNNLKIRGIPESVQQSDLGPYAATLFKNLIPSLTDLDVPIDRIHLLPKPSHLSDHIPRDILLRLHFFHVKENLMSCMQKHDQIPSQYQSLQFFTDLLQYTLQKRRNLNTVTKALRNHKIAYKWGYPTKLTVTRKNHTYTITTLERGVALLKVWDILPEPEAVSPTTSTPWQVDRPWKEVTAKNAKSHL